MKNARSNTNIIKENISRILKKKKIKIGRLCKELGLSRFYLNHAKEFSHTRLSDIAIALDVSIFELIEDDSFRKLYNESGELIQIERISH